MCPNSKEPCSNGQGSQPSNPANREEGQPTGSTPTTTCHQGTSSHCRILPNEETQPHHLISVATDWTLSTNRTLAANCRNISDEVFPGIHLGDRFLSSE